MFVAVLVIAIYAILGARSASCDDVAKDICKIMIMSIDFLQSMRLVSVHTCTDKQFRPVQDACVPTMSESGDKLWAHSFFGHDHPEYFGDFGRAVFTLVACATMS